MGVDERRRRVREFFGMGFSPSHIVELVASEFKCSERTVWRDWSSRGEWMSGFGAPDKFVVEAFIRLALEGLELREMLLKDSRDFNDYAKVRMCKVLSDSLFDEFDRARDLGVFEAYNMSRLAWSLIKEVRRSNGGDVLEWDIFDDQAS